MCSYCYIGDSNCNVDSTFPNPYSVVHCGRLDRFSAAVSCLKSVFPPGRRAQSATIANSAACRTSGGNNVQNLRLSIYSAGRLSSISCRGVHIQLPVAVLTEICRASGNTAWHQIQKVLVDGCKKKKTRLA